MINVVKVKRLRHSTARADGYHIVCPYKACGHLFSVDGAKKDHIVKCPNCSKDSKITKVE